MFYHDGTPLVAKLTDSQGKPIVNATIYFNINGWTMLNLLMLMVLHLWDLI